MRDIAGWSLVVAAIISLVIAAIPWTEAKSASQTVGVQIIMPPRSSPTQTPLEEALSVASADASIQRTTTVVHEGSSMTVLVTDAPLI